MQDPATTPAEVKIKQTISTHPVVSEISNMVRQGKSFQEILDTYTEKQNLNPDKVAEIHEFKSRIQEALRIGTPLEQVIDSVFSDPEIKGEIMENINNYKANRTKSTY